MTITKLRERVKSAKVWLDTIQGSNHLSKVLHLADAERDYKEMKAILTRAEQARKRRKP